MNSLIPQAAVMGQSMSRAILCGAIVSCVVLGFQSAWAGEASGAKGKEPKLAGIWVSIGGFLDPKGPAFHPFVKLNKPGKSGPPSFKPPYAGRTLEVQDAQIEAGNAAASDLGATCIPPGMPSIMSPTFAVEFLQTPGQVTMLFEWANQVRRVYTDGRGHPDPDDWTPSFNGHSIGHWEADTLIVDTVGIRTDSSGMPHSDKMHITERIRLIDENTMDVAMVVDDPEALNEPWKTRFVYTRRTDLEMMEYDCEENNRNTTDLKIRPSQENK